MEQILQYKKETLTKTSSGNYVAYARNGYNTDHPAENNGKVFWNNPEYFTKTFLKRAEAKILHLENS